MTRENTAVLVCNGPSFNVEDWPTLRDLGDTCVVNYAHVPIRRRFGDDFKPTFAFGGDSPVKVMPQEWHHSSEVLTVCAQPHAWRILKDADTKYVETWTHKKNHDWDGDPFDGRSAQLLTPYKSMLLAIQWLAKQGYRTIALYGAELRGAGGYGGVPEYQANDGKSYGKYRSHSVEAFVLYWYVQHARKHGLRFVNLSPSSVLADFMDTLTPEELLEDQELEAAIEQASDPLDYEAVYEDIYARGYHNDFQNCRAKKLCELLVKDYQFHSVLDIGCSNGWSVDFFARNGKRAKGLEVSASAVAAAKRLLLDVEQGTATDLSRFADGSFDCVTSADVMEHLTPSDAVEAVAEQARVSARYVAVRVSPTLDRGHGKQLAGRHLHLTVQPIERWVDLYRAHGLTPVYRKGKTLVFEKRVEDKSPFEGEKLTRPLKTTSVAWQHLVRFGFDLAQIAYRDTWLNDAEKSSLLTLPALRVRGIRSAVGQARGTRTTHGGSHGELKPFTNVGRDGVNTLANTLLTLLFPLDIRWFRLTIDDEQRDLLIDNGVFENEEAIEETLRAIEDRMIERMESHSLRSELHSLFRRNLVEGNNVLHIFRKGDGSTGIRHIPMRNHVTNRVNGEVARLIIRDETPDANGKARELFTEVNYQEGKVYQLEVGGNRKNAKEVPDNPNFYIPVSPQRATLEDYADGYVYELQGDLELHNNLTRNLDRAVAIFSKTVMVNDQNKSGIDTYELADLRAGEAIDGVVSAGVADGIGWITSGLKLNDISFVVNVLERIEDRLTRQFAGLLGTMLDNFAQPRTATEVSRLASELDTFAAGLGQVYNANLQRPLAQAYLELVQTEEGAAGETAIRPTIVAGNSQLSRLQELSKFMQALQYQLQANPEFSSVVKWRAVWHRITNALGIDTDDILKTEEEIKAEQQDAAQQQQLIQQAEQLREQQLRALRQQRIAENNDDRGQVA
eukprot:g5780.t1